VPSRIIIAEDDEGLAYMLDHFLKRAGHQAKVFTSALVAWDSFKVEPRPRLLITDLVFPAKQPNGVALAAHASRQYPRLPVTFVTGDTDVASRVRGTTDGPILAKPIDVDTLMQHVAYLAPLDSGVPASNDTDALKRDWQRADILAALQQRGFTLKSLSIAYGYHPTAPSIALKRPWPAVERIIADALGTTAPVVWPSRYDLSGQAHREQTRKPSRRKVRHMSTHQCAG